jgi:hypothetical protein
MTLETDLPTILGGMSRRIADLESAQNSPGQVVDDNGTVFTSEGTGSLVSGTVKVYVQDDAPTGLNASTDVGTQWYDSNGGNAKTWWDGFVFLSYVSTTPFFPGSTSLAAMGPALQARTLVSARIYTQGTAPSSPAHGWMWRDTSAGNAIKRWNGTSWQTISDTNLINAVNVALANPVADLSDSYITMFFQATAPGGQTATDEGNLWFDIDDAYRESYWDGTGWVISPTESVSGVTDGTPPPYSPTPTGRAGWKSLFLQWTAVPNRDPVRYHIYVDNVTPVVKTSTTYAGWTQGTMASIVGKLPDGTDFVNGETYFAKIVAQDDDGVAADGPEISISGVVGLIDSTEITDNAIKTPQLDTNAITTDHLITNNLLADAINATDMSAVTMTAPHIRTDVADDLGLHIDATGLRVYPPGGGQAPFFEVNSVLGFLIAQGEATLNRLTTVGEAEFNGNVEFSPGTVVNLMAGVTAPKNSPTVSGTYITGPNFTNDSDWDQRHGWATDGTNFYTFNVRTKRLEKWSSAGVRTAQSTAITKPVRHASVAYGGGKVWVMMHHYYAPPTVNVSTLNVYRYSTALAQEATDEWTTAKGWATEVEGTDPADASCIGYIEGDANPIILAQRRPSTNQIRFYRATMPSSTLTTSLSVSYPWSSIYNIRSVVWSNGFDFGDSVARYCIMGHSGTRAHMFQSLDGERRIQDEFTFTTMPVGIAYDGTKFIGQTTNGIMRTFTDLDKAIDPASASMTKWISVEYVRPSIPARTQQSPKYVYPAFPKRSKMTITGPDLPASPTATQPDRLDFYVGSGATEPNATNMHRQTNPGVGLKTAVYTALTTGGGNPDTGPAFPASGISTIITPDAFDAVGEIVSLNSDGPGRVGPVKFNEEGKVPLGLYFSNTAQNLTHADWTKRTGWAVMDTAAGANGFTHSSGDFTCLEAGFILVSYSLLFESSSVASRRVGRCLRDGTEVHRDDRYVGTVTIPPTVGGCFPLWCDEGAVLQFEMYHTNGASPVLQTGTSPSRGSQVNLYRLSV